MDALRIDSKGLKTIDDYEKQFDLIAQKLMNECSLIINNRYNRIVNNYFFKIYGAIH